MAKSLKTKKVVVIEKRGGKKTRRIFGIVYQVLKPRHADEKTLHQPLSCFNY